MSLKEIIADSGTIVVVILTLVQFAPIKVNPWSQLARWIGRALNGGDVMAKLEEHIRIDDERDADIHRYRILRFNREVLQKVKHTEEEFNEVMYSINCYERFCKEHPKYENNRAVLAIENVKRVYRKCMENHDFLYDRGAGTDE